MYIYVYYIDKHCSGVSESRHMGRGVKRSIGAYLTILILYRYDYENLKKVKV